jgi:hypothetical protein
MMLRVITPVMRLQNIEVLKTLLYGKGIVWHVLMSDDIPSSIQNVSWIQPLKLNSEPRGTYGYWKLNQFTDYIDEDRYWFLSDDDAFSSDFFDVAEKHRDADMLIVNMKRWLGLSPEVLVASPDNIRIGGVGLEQMIVKGKWLKGKKFNEYDYCSDGHFVIELVKNLGDKVVYEQDAVVYWNCLSRGEQ